jgi:hypothetical protein
MAASNCGQINMKQFDYMAMDDVALVAAANNTKLGLSRAFAIEALAARALENSELLDVACTAISGDRKIGFHVGMPVGWLGADKIFSSGQEAAIRKLLLTMNNWKANEQEDLVRHWAGKGKLNALTTELIRQHGWQPRYELRDM